MPKEGRSSRFRLILLPAKISSLLRFVDLIFIEAATQAVSLPERSLLYRSLII